MATPSFFKKHQCELRMLFGATFSAILYGISIKVFIGPSQLVTGGVSGIAIIMARFFFPAISSQAYSILYVLLNIPLFILAFVGLGRKFAIFTAYNVVLASLIIGLVPDATFAWINISNDMLATGIFGGVLTGLSTGVALNYGTSAGGIDIIAAYIGEKRGTQIGKYLLLINAVVLTTAGLVFGSWIPVLYTMIYIFVSSWTVNYIHSRNKKNLIRIVSSKKDEIAAIIMNVIHHGCTITEGEGAYTKQHRFIIDTVVPHSDVALLLKLVYQIDNSAFITVSNIEMVKGRFILKKLD